MGFRQNIFRPTHLKRFVFFAFCDLGIVIGSLVVSFLLRFDFRLPSEYRPVLLNAIPFFAAIKLAHFVYFRLYHLSWRFVSLKDLLNILKAVALSSVSVATGVFFFQTTLLQGFPRSVLVIDSVLTFLLIATLRIGKRAYVETIRGAYRAKGHRTVIVGAGNTGEMILRDMQRAGFREYAPIAFLDDDLNRVGTYLHGVKVMGTLDDLSRVIALYQAAAVIIAIPSLGHVRLRDLYTRSKEAGVSEIKIVPRIYDFHRPELRVQELEDIKIEDLIGRQAVRIDAESIARFMENRSVLITGAGGSIGFELTSQLCGFNPREVILFDVDETALYQAELTLKRRYPALLQRLRVLVGDVRDVPRVERVFSRYKPEIVFHAAAYKHVPMMEYNAAEAVKTNVFGTYHVARAALTWGATRFVMISTDKAVKPTSVMGATKRMAEHICRAFGATEKTAYVSVRFGNVLGSRGSVLPLFLEQIQHGIPLTVTHKDMERYFMTIPEAVSLVLEASVIGRGGEVMVLDMGRPVKIVDLAHDLLKLHGLEAYKDVDIEFIGPRPGEKFFEEVLTAEEGTIATRHEKIFIAPSQEQFSIAQVEEALKRFEDVVGYSDGEGDAVSKLLREYVHWYQATAAPQQERPAVRSVIVVPNEHVRPAESA